MRKQALQDVEVAKRDVIEGLVKGLEVIRAFSDESVRLSASELSDKVGLTRSAARRYLLTLVHVGMAQTDGHQFWLTPKVLSLGHSYLDSARLPRAIVPFLQRLTTQLQESTNYSVLEGDDVVYVSRVNAPRLLAPGFDPGTRLPAYTSTAGRVLLSGLPEEELHAYLERVELVAYTHMTVTDKNALRRELLTIRQDGFAVTENQYEVGMRGISVPIKSRRGELVGALSVSMSIASCSRAEAAARCVPALQATANTVMLWI
ncbi:helix-turn-helix domain-containing protein [Duganella sp. FT80W]|uniref:Helix-turn-helix domain-containing protein n=1 Tax=Duganella guangzhouensis TaxID=2666084 RepID=A0A6I2KZX9_9BURK|nr:IclR family transcriptional regulator C-terminal domain-containing protein [Duganella guangzhouensis]MRW91448.1 helix-turn-helix domain-containing protein [Duganella guangzhouensis]